MSYTDTLAALASSTERTVVALYQRMEAGQISEQEFVALAVAALARAESRAVALADVALAATLSAQRQEAVPALGLTPPADAEQRAATAVAALLISAAYLLDPPAAVAVTARDQTLAAAQAAYGQGMRRQGVTAWTRALNSGACELCEDLAGDVLPASADMYRHKGCGCSQRPVA